MNGLPDIKQLTADVESKIDYTFNDKSLIVIAFTHRSYINESRWLKKHNERLEFLGDSVLGLLVSSYLYRIFPDMPEGDLSALRAKLVNAASCITYLQKLNVAQYLLMGKGERLNDGRGRESILSDLFEAIIGAIFLDGGYDAAETFLFSHFKTAFDGVLDSPCQNPKAILQDYCQKFYQQPPFYKVISEEGPDHSKTFKIIVAVSGTELGCGEGSSKKEAQQAAAWSAVNNLKLSSSE